MRGRRGAVPMSRAARSHGLWARASPSRGTRIASDAIWSDRTRLAARVARCSPQIASDAINELRNG